MCELLSRCVILSITTRRSPYNTSVRAGTFLFGACDCHFIEITFGVFDLSSSFSWFLLCQRSFILLSLYFCHFFLSLLIRSCFISLLPAFIYSFFLFFCYIKYSTDEPSLCFSFVWIFFIIHIFLHFIKCLFIFLLTGADIFLY